MWRASSVMTQGTTVVVIPTPTEASQPSSLLDPKSEVVAPVSSGVQASPSEVPATNASGKTSPCLTGLPVNVAGDVGPVTPMTDTTCEPIPKCTVLTPPTTVSDTLLVDVTTPIPSVLPLQIRTEGTSSAGPTVTTEQHGSATSMVVTGTGSITATPSAYTTAVTTIASSTTTTTADYQLGKRIRKSSTKYEDYKSQVPLVSISLSFSPPLSFPCWPLCFSPLHQKLQPSSDHPSKGQGRLTNQLQYMKTVLRACWRHHYAWPFHKPVDPVALSIPVSPAFQDRCCGCAYMNPFLVSTFAKYHCLCVIPASLHYD